MKRNERLEFISLLSNEICESTKNYFAVRKKYGYSVGIGTDGLKSNENRTAIKRRIRLLREELQLLSKALDE